MTGRGGKREGAGRKPNASKLPVQTGAANQLAAAFGRASTVKPEGEASASWQAPLASGSSSGADW